MKIESFYDVETATFTYIVWDEQTKDAVVIDPILDLNLTWMKISTVSLAKLSQRIRELNLIVHFVFDTHTHADHLSGATQLSKKLGAKSAISSNFSTVRKQFSIIYGTTVEQLNGNYDLYISDDDVVNAGSLSIRAINTPGHTPACLSLHVENALFVGDALFQPLLGTGRCDFPSGSSTTLFHSIKRLYQLPDDTVVYTGHDYPAAGREAQPSFRLTEAKKFNKFLRANTSEQEFVAARNARDRELTPPRLLFFSMWANINSGYPPRAANGYYHFPIPIQFE